MTAAQSQGVLVSSLSLIAYERDNANDREIPDLGDTKDEREEFLKDRNRQPEARNVLPASGWRRLFTTACVIKTDSRSIYFAPPRL